MKGQKTVNVVGAGLAGLSAALTLASCGISCNLISSQPSERAQSVLAEGGINAALNTMGENDSTAEHFADTMRGGCNLESESAVRNLTENAPEAVKRLAALGVPFRSRNGQLILRNFGGQKKKRTAFAKSSTGKMIMTALIDEVRKYEVSGLVRRYPHHEMTEINISCGRLKNIVVRDLYTQKMMTFSGTAILCTGGINGFFDGMTTGTVQNTGNAAAAAFDAGVEFADMEFIQYHPTTVSISNKKMLISEAARGEGGRLYIVRNGKPWYFMEEKYPLLGNLMPRDVVSREMFFVMHRKDCTDEVYLDMTELNDDIWKNKLSDLRSEIIAYLHKDPKQNPIAVSPGIHFFMGGIRVNDCHETNIRGLYAAGEAACKYHGANRLGGNSMLAAVYGGSKAAQAAIETACIADINTVSDSNYSISLAENRRLLRDQLMEGMGIVRDFNTMEETRSRLEELYHSQDISRIDRIRTNLGLAMIESALARKESRGAHYRIDFPEMNPEYQKLTTVRYENGKRYLRFLTADEWERK